MDIMHIYIKYVYVKIIYVVHCNWSKKHSIVKSLLSFTNISTSELGLSFLCGRKCNSSDAFSFAGTL